MSKPMCMGEGYNYPRCRLPRHPEHASALTARINPPFRVLYDLRWMELGRAGGVEQATYELVDAISRWDRKNAYRILAPRSACWEWEFPRQFQVERIYSDDGEARGARFHADVAARRELPFDLVHSTCSYIHPELLDFPGVLTIHDLQHLHHPEFFSAAQLREREIYRESAERALHIICISEFTRRDVHQRFGVPLEKMTTIWNIPSAQTWREIEARARRRLLRRMGIEGPFLFYPAQSWPHKNHERLVAAFAQARSEIPRDIKLVFTGSAFAPGHPAGRLIAEHGLGSRVMHLGLRSPLEMRALYQECLALVFPSLFEGFGMPVAEAIIAGKPVACSNRSSLPEIAGEAAVMFDPEDEDQMGRCMLEISTDAGLRESMSHAARQRRRVFGERRSALATLAVYENVFERTAS
jgi:glycosyltransferase involved in cell wall biosynthesis